MSTVDPPEEWRGRTVYTLDVLLFVRENLQEGIMPDFFLGVNDVHAMVAFTEGMALSFYYNGRRDDEYRKFLAWLRDVKQEHPFEGWAMKFLNDCSGDHLAAIKKFLDYAAEFKALESK